MATIQMTVPPSDQLLATASGAFAGGYHLARRPCAHVVITSPEALAANVVIESPPGTVRLVILEWRDSAVVERQRVRYPRWADEIDRQVAELRGALNGD